MICLMEAHLDEIENLIKHLWKFVPQEESKIIPVLQYIKDARHGYITKVEE